MRRAVGVRKAFSLVLAVVFVSMICVPAVAETWQSDEETGAVNVEPLPLDVAEAPSEETTDAVVDAPLAMQAQPPVIVAASAYVDAYEDDDSVSQARAIVPGAGTESHTIHVLGDQDWVKFDVVAGGRYFIETLPGDIGFDTELYLFSSDGVTQIAYDDDTGHGGTFSKIDFKPGDSETVYVAAMANSNSSTGSYGLRVTGGPFGADAYEPDNDMASAHAITVNGPAQERTFHVNTDDDWVRVELVANEDYTFQTHPGDPGLDTYLYLYDSDGVQLDSNDDAVSLYSTIYYTAADTGTFYLKVRSYGYAYTGRYLLTATATSSDSGDTYEVDDTPASAKPIAADGIPQARSLHVVDDLDYVSFQAQAGVIYRIETHEITSGLDTEMSLFDSDGVTPLDYDDDGGIARMSYIEHTAAETETLYVLVHPYDLGETGEYSLSVFGLVPDVYESDNTSAAAKAILPGVAQRRTFHENADEDWVKLEVTAGLKYTIDTRPGESDMDTMMYLYDSDGATEIDSDDDSGPGYYSHLEYEATESKTLYVRIYGNLQDMYLLKVECDDLTPPLTTSNALSSYNISATITLTASDPAPGVGVAAIYYSLDGAPKQAYSAPITVSAAGAHSLEYWSVDKVTNEESHKTATFQVIAAKKSTPARTSGSTTASTASEETTVVAVSTTPTPTVTPEGDGESEGGTAELTTTSAGDLGDDDGNQAPILGWVVGSLLVLLMLGGVAAFARKK